MIFQPVLPTVFVVLIVLGFGGLVVWAAIRSSGAARAVWATRLLLVLACGALLLRPGVPGAQTETLATEIDIFFVVDTTASIVAEDWDGDQPRIDGVRADVREIVNTYPGARFAVITFDASAALRVPLTTDATAVVSSIGVLRPEVTANSRGSSVGIAASLLEDTLASAARQRPDRIRLVFYFGDGEQTSGAWVESFDRSHDYLVGGAVLGYGTQAGGPMRITTLSDVEPDYIMYQGERALSVIDPANLQKIASELGIEYQERSAERELVLPEVTATTVTTNGTTGAVAEFSWLVALVIAALLAIELARSTTALLAATRVARRPSGGSDS